MKGHLPLIAMRRAGKAPVLVSLYDTDVCQWRDWQDWEELGALPQILIESTDAPHRLDLRFLVGLRVTIAVSSADRLTALAGACRRAGAVQVVGSARKFDGDRMTTLAHIELEAAHG